MAQQRSLSVSCVLRSLWRLEGLLRVVERRERCTVARVGALSLFWCEWKIVAIPNVSKEEPPCGYPKRIRRGAPLPMMPSHDVILVNPNFKTSDETGAPELKGEDRPTAPPRLV